MCTYVVLIINTLGFPQYMIWCHIDAQGSEVYSHVCEACVWHDHVGLIMRNAAQLHCTACTTVHIPTQILPHIPGAIENIEVKVVRTHALDSDVQAYQDGSSMGAASGSASSQDGSQSETGQQTLCALPVAWAPDTGDMLVPCQGGASVLRVCLVQPPTKKAMAARDFRNGLRGKDVLVRSL